MSRFVSTIRLALVLGLLAAMPALAQDSSSSSEESTVPPELQGLVGDFILEQEDESLPKCPISFTDQQSIGGWQVVLPEACPAPYPPAESLMSWNVNADDGSILLMDGERHVVMQLFEDEDGLYDTDPNVTPRFYLLSPYDEDGTGGEVDGTDETQAAD
ncbi:MAG TPA: AprI/Inh family metalloprotease inhibitor [Devosia sp.]|nr:AprI/Inh family metalloprotease inhibitor [Devosia sp.]